MKYFLYLLFLIQFQNCKSDTNLSTNISSNENVKNNQRIQDNYLINSIDKTAIGGKINQENKVKQLKNLLKTAFEREIEKPYMWDIFVSNNDSLLQFYNYKIFQINTVNFKSYYIKIQYEDGNYQCILLVNESSNIEYNSMIVYEELNSEEKYMRTTQIKGDNVQINFKSPIPHKSILFKVMEGKFLDNLDALVVNKKWGDKKIVNSKEIFEYQIKGKTTNHLKSGYWIEKRYSFEYGKSIIQDGNYINGLRDGEWNFSPDGPVDMIKKFNKGKFISKSYL